MKTLYFAPLLLWLCLPALAEEGKTCAAVKSCDVTQVTKVGRKKSTAKNKLNFDYLCDSDVHSLPLKGGMELELAIVKKKVVASLKAAGAPVVTKTAGLSAKKIALKYKAKKEGEPSVDIVCKP